MFPDYKIILPVAMVLQRAAELISRLPTSFGFHMFSYDIREDIKSFSVVLALATAPEVWDLLLKVSPHGRILFGSGTPSVCS